MVAGMKGDPRVKPHSIRHRFATRLMERGATIKEIQACLGHADANTTFIYLHMKEQGATVMQGITVLKEERSFPTEPKPSLPMEKIRNLGDFRRERDKMRVRMAQNPHSRRQESISGARPAEAAKLR